MIQRLERIVDTNIDPPKASSIVNIIDVDIDINNPERWCFER
jgi:hypothetical protein